MKKKHKSTEKRKAEALERIAEMLESLKRDGVDVKSQPSQTKSKDSIWDGGMAFGGDR